MSDPDPTLFFTRPISLFFVILAAVSLVFPFWQRRRREIWARFYLPVCLIFISLSFWITPGWLKIAAALFVAGGLFLGWWHLNEMPEASRAAPY